MCVSIFAVDAKDTERELVGYTNFRLFNQFGVCHFREMLKLQMVRNQNASLTGEMTSQPDSTHSEVTVRLSVDDGFTKTQNRGGKKTRPAELVQFTPAKQMRMSCQADFANIDSMASCEDINDHAESLALIKVTVTNSKYTGAQIIAGASQHTVAGAQFSYVNAIFVHYDQ